MLVKLTRLKSSHGNLRTDSVVGQLEAWPALGAPMMVTADPLEWGDIRLVTTSPVVAVSAWDCLTLVRTENSLYSLERLEDHGAEEVD